MFRTAAYNGNITMAKSMFMALLFLGLYQFGYAANNIVNDTIGFNQYKGKVIDSKSKKELVFASLTVNGTNISTITNTQGEYLLKVPKKFSERRVTISFLGYTSQVIRLSDILGDKHVIRLETHIEELSELILQSEMPTHLFGRY